MPTCPSCGATSRDGARFCSGCGTTLGPAPGNEPTAVSPLPPITPGPAPIVVPGPPPYAAPTTPIAASTTPFAAPRAPTKQVLAPPPLPPAEPVRSPTAGLIAAGVVALLVGVAIVGVVLSSGGGDTVESSSTGAPAPTPDEQVQPDATSAPPTTSPPRPSTTTTTEPPVPAAVRTAQRLATALAASDWQTARSMQPDRAGTSDASFASSYGDLVASTVVPADPVSIGTSQQTLGLGLVAHQIDDNGSQVTTVYCVIWTVDPAAQTVFQQDGSFDLPVVSGHVDPESQRSTIEATC